MKTVLITGATGFIGHFLVQEFISDHNVICLVRPGTKNLKRLTEYFNKITILEHDLKDSLQKLESKLQNVEIVLHAGGNPSAADSLNNPLDVINDNVIGTANLLEFSRKNNIKNFVYYSSGEVFGPIDIGKDSKETDAYYSHSPYAASKAAGEEICISYSKSYNLPVSIVHINNTFGPKCQTNRLPVILLNNILQDNPINIHTSDDGLISGRRWFYAGDVALHTRFILEHQKSLCEKWNSAGSRFINNLEFAKLFAYKLDKELKYNLIPINNPNHKTCFSIDPSKLYLSGYKDMYTLEQRIEQTIDWYLKNPDWLK